jgi:hypothetical protein
MSRSVAEELWLVVGGVAARTSVISVAHPRTACHHSSPQHGTPSSIRMAVMSAQNAVNPARHHRHVQNHRTHTHARSTCVEV